MNLNLHLDKFAEKFGYRKTIFFIVFVIFLSNIFSYSIGRSQINNNISIQVPNVSQGQQKSTQETLASEDNQLQKNFKDYTEEWDFGTYNNQNDGYYCPNFFSGYPAPEIWYKQQVPAVFRSITFSYSIKNVSKNSSPSFIFSLGKSTRIFRFFVPQENPQSVGFEKFYQENDNFTSKHLPGKSLSHPIMTNSTIHLKIRSQIEKGNLVSYTFNISYISSLNTPEEDIFSYNIEYPDPEPNNADLQIGFATFKGNCIKPITYQIEK